MTHFDFKEKKTADLIVAEGVLLLPTSAVVLLSFILGLNEKIMMKGV